ncbi:hypothetical protein C5E41_31460 [Nocardia nova]|nr:hypothetical protein C5E41_31460 [Nocardia nova]
MRRPGGDERSVGRDDAHDREFVLDSSQTTENIRRFNLGHLVFSMRFGALPLSGHPEPCRKALPMVKKNAVH